MYNDKDLSTWQTFRRLRPITAPFKAGLIVAGVALILNAASDTFMLSPLRPPLDGDSGKTDHSVLMWMPLVAAGLTILRGITSYIFSYYISQVSREAVMIMCHYLFDHMIGILVSFFDRQPTDTLLLRIICDSEQVVSSFSGALTTVVREDTLIVGLFIMMFYCSWQLSIILIVPAPIASTVVRVVSKRLHSISRDMQNTMGQVTTNAEQILKDYKGVLTFGGQEVEAKHFDKVSGRTRPQGMKVVSASPISGPIVQLTVSPTLAFVLYAVSFPSVMDSLTAGTTTVAFSSMVALMCPLKSLANVNAQFQCDMTTCQTLFTILDSKQEKDGGKHVIERVADDVEFRNVIFTYSGCDVPALCNISLRIPAGKTAVLVGQSGSDKPTIVSLVTCFYDTDEGEILMDGYDLCGYILTLLRNQVTLVSQNAHLLNDTVINNVVCVRTEQYSREQIEEAARVTHVVGFINKVDNGLDTVISESGVLLSGGQRQCTAITRTLLRDSPILTLDEATSALDTESGHTIQAALDESQKNRISLMIAHRPSTIEKADEIVVIENDVIVERGTYNDLPEHCGVYAQFHRMQFGQ